MADDIDFVDSFGTLQQIFSYTLSRRNILATSSPYFRAMFCSDLRESHDFRVTFNDISSETMGRILNYIYLGKEEILATVTRMLDVPRLITSEIELQRVQGKSVALPRLDT